LERAGLNVVFALVDSKTGLFRFVGYSENGLEVVTKQLKPSSFHKGKTPFYKWLRKLYRHKSLAEIYVLAEVSDKKDLITVRDQWVDTYQSGACKVDALEMLF
jgi:NAD-dependent SIR2 family protein deacetylase